MPSLIQEKLKRQERRTSRRRLGVAAANTLLAGSVLAIGANVAVHSTESAVKAVERSVSTDRNFDHPLGSDPTSKKAVEQALTAEGEDLNQVVLHRVTEGETTPTAVAADMHAINADGAGEEIAAQVGPSGWLDPGVIAALPKYQITPPHSGETQK